MLIDMFEVPEDSKAAFLEHTRAARDVVRAQPGFVEGSVYEAQSPDAQFHVITQVVWDNEYAFEAAKAAVAEEFRRRGFKPAEIMKELNVKLTRAAYERTRYAAPAASSDRSADR